MIYCVVLYVVVEMFDQEVGCVVCDVYIFVDEIVVYVCLEVVEVQVDVFYCCVQFCGEVVVQLFWVQVGVDVVLCGDECVV